MVPRFRCHKSSPANLTFPLFPLLLEEPFFTQTVRVWFLMSTYQPKSVFCGKFVSPTLLKSISEDFPILDLPFALISVLLEDSFFTQTLCLVSAGVGKVTLRHSSQKSHLHKANDVWSSKSKAYNVK